MDSAILLCNSYLLESDLLSAERYPPFEKHDYHHQGSCNFRQTNFKDFSRIFQGQITVFKD